MFQIVSIILWSFDDYYYYAACIALISAASIITTLLETRRTIKRMREMSRFTCAVRVLREGQWAVRDSADLVPGDVYDVAESGLLLFPADSVLLSGDAIVNESMLTGESVPVSKVPLTDAAIAGLHAAGGEVPPDLARHFLFSGTRIIRIRATGGEKDGEAGAKAMVVRTGFDTTKGALVRSMLFPKPMGFKFYRDSFRFIGFLAGIAGVGFLASSVNFVKLGIAWHTIVVRALDLITVVVPPALPATMSIGTTFAIARLRKGGIFCISPNRVNIGGKINVVCFDKTGTLTADGLDVLGTRTIDLRARRFSELHEQADEMPVNPNSQRGDAEARKLPLLYALATCHSLKVVDGEVIGDPLDVKMFEFTGWTLDEGKEQAARATTKVGTAKDGKSRLTERAPALVQTVVRPPGGQQFEVEDAVKPGKHAHFLERELCPPRIVRIADTPAVGVLRTFDFVSQLRRMSVIVKRLKSPSMEVFVKGAPEVMQDICEADSFPADYDDLLAYYTKHGYRVIACAGKTISDMSWIKAQRMKREQAESGLRFLGLIIFENKIKEGTAPAIATLTNANIICKMATGDNPRTAISVARECGMVGQSAHVFLPSFVEGARLATVAPLPH
jgi:cation-transporting ATPase 13A3/4/5